MIHIHICKTLHNHIVSIVYRLIYNRLHTRICHLPCFIVNNKVPSLRYSKWPTSKKNLDINVFHLHPKTCQCASSNLPHVLPSCQGRNSKTNDTNCQLPKDPTTKIAKYDIFPSSFYNLPTDPRELLPLQGHASGTCP